MPAEVILVDPQDQVLGKMEKLEVHEKGLLHRAFSIFLFNSKGEMLIQQRALEKYHSPGLWTNACCSHPSPGESLEQACSRRLMEELGISAELSYMFQFTYRAELENGLIEHELDHVYTGTYEGNIPFNPQEIKAIKWLKPTDLIIDIEQNPNHYTAWFKIIIKDVLSRYIAKAS